MYNVQRYNDHSSQRMQKTLLFSINRTTMKTTIALFVALFTASATAAAVVADAATVARAMAALDIFIVSRKQ